MSTTTVKKKPAQKTTLLSDRKYCDQAPKEVDIAFIKNKEGEIIGKFLPIGVVERDLDRWAWSTQNFTYLQYRDRFGNPSITAELQLVIPWLDEKGITSERRLVGACNFVLASYEPNKHFLATARSECVKNAASDLGKKFGRGLNAEAVPINNDGVVAAKSTGKMKPDANILAQLKKAIEEGDETHKGILLSIYEFIPEEINHEH